MSSSDPKPAGETSSGVVPVDDEPATTKKKFGPRSAIDIQRAKLAKLMKDPTKPVHIPQKRKERDPNQAPDFVYNVMGSSAGAGSGEFHVYRQIRRKETLRQNVLTARKERDDLNEAYHQKLAENERVSKERTEKNRQKRLKKNEARKKARQKRRKLEKETQSGTKSAETSDDEASSDEHDDNEATLIATS